MESEITPTHSHIVSADPGYMRLLNSINRLHGYDLFSPGSTSLDLQRLPFYRDFMLLKATGFSSIPPMRMHFLVRGEEIVKLDGSSSPLEEVAGRADLCLTEDTVRDYSRFYLAHLWSAEGNIRVVESIEEVQFCRDPSEEEQQALCLAVRPMAVSQGKDGFVVNCVATLGDTVRALRLSIAERGSLEVAGDEVLLSGMPVRPILLL